MLLKKENLPDWHYQVIDTLCIIPQQKLLILAFLDDSTKAEKERNLLLYTLQLIQLGQSSDEDNPKYILLFLYHYTSLLRAIYRQQMYFGVFDLPCNGQKLQVAGYIYDLLNSQFKSLGLANISLNQVDLSVFSEQGLELPSLSGFNTFLSDFLGLCELPIDYNNFDIGLIDTFLGLLSVPDIEKKFPLPIDWAVINILFARTLPRLLCSDAQKSCVSTFLPFISKFMDYMERFEFPGPTSISVNLIGQAIQRLNPLELGSSLKKDIEFFFIAHALLIFDSKNKEKLFRLKLIIQWLQQQISQSPDCIISSYFEALFADMSEHYSLDSVESFQFAHRNNKLEQLEIFDLYLWSKVNPDVFDKKERAVVTFLVDLYFRKSIENSQQWLSAQLKMPAKFLDHFELVKLFLNVIAMYRFCELPNNSQIISMIFRTGINLVHINLIVDGSDEYWAAIINFYKVLICYPTSKAAVDIAFLHVGMALEYYPYVEEKETASNMIRDLYVAHQLCYQSKGLETSTQGYLGVSFESKRFLLLFLKVIQSGREIRIKQIGPFIRALRDLASTDPQLVLELIFKVIIKSIFDREQFLTLVEQSFGFEASDYDLIVSDLVLFELAMDAADSILRSSNFCLKEDALKQTSFFKLMQDVWEESKRRLEQAKSYLHEQKEFFDTSELLIQQVVRRAAVPTRYGTRELRQVYQIEYGGGRIKSNRNGQKKPKKRSSPGASSTTIFSELDNKLLEYVTNNRDGKLSRLDEFPMGKYFSDSSAELQAMYLSVFINSLPDVNKQLLKQSQRLVLRKNTKIASGLKEELARLLLESVIFFEKTEAEASIFEISNIIFDEEEREFLDKIQSRDRMYGARFSQVSEKKVQEQCDRISTTFLAFVQENWRYFDIKQSGNIVSVLSDVVIELEESQNNITCIDVVEEILNSQSDMREALLLELKENNVFLKSFLACLQQQSRRDSFSELNFVELVGLASGNGSQKSNLLLYGLSEHIWDRLFDYAKAQFAANLSSLNIFIPPDNKNQFIEKSLSLVRQIFQTITQKTNVALFGGSLLRCALEVESSDIFDFDIACDADREIVIDCLAPLVDRISIKKSAYFENCFLIRLNESGLSLDVHCGGISNTQKGFESEILYTPATQIYLVYPIDGFLQQLGQPLVLGDVDGFIKCVETRNYDFHNIGLLDFNAKDCVKLLNIVNKLHLKGLHLIDLTNLLEQLEKALDTLFELKDINVENHRIWCAAKNIFDRISGSRLFPEELSPIYTLLRRYFTIQVIEVSKFSVFIENTSEATKENMQPEHGLQ